MKFNNGPHVESPAAPAKPLKIDIIVHGRFHGFALAKALIGLGHDVLVHTNYPRAIVSRFGVPPANTRSFVRHGVFARAANRISHLVSEEALDRMLHTLFGRWAARGMRQDSDVVYGFSGVMEEALRLPKLKHGQLRVLVRGSAHIAEQNRILLEEESRAGVRLDKPTRWMIAREEREYVLADTVSVLSSFAAESFRTRGFPANRLNTMPLGVDVSQFMATAENIANRCNRILAGQPLRVLTVGTFSFRKGAADLIAIAQQLSGRMRFRFVGSRSKETDHLSRDSSSFIELIGRVPESELPSHYAWADVFLFPTLEDGFAAVLLQAAASGLPILSTTNCAAPDFIQQGRTGFILPIRDVNGFVDRLLGLDRDRHALVDQALASSASVNSRDWSQMAAELVALPRPHNLCDQI
jgi:glycosyltransferase involved in cell wall biosynthesis